MFYQIRVRGRLDSAWSEWFDGLTITHDAGGDTTLAGELIDQAALHGVLSKVRDLGLSLLAIDRREDAGESGSPDRREEEDDVR